MTREEYLAYLNRDRPVSPTGQFHFSGLRQPSWVRSDGTVDIELVPVGTVTTPTIIYSYTMKGDDGKPSVLGDGSAVLDWVVGYFKGGEKGVRRAKLDTSVHPIERAEKQYGPFYYKKPEGKLHEP